MPCNQGACELCVYKISVYKLIVSKEDRSLEGIARRQDRYNRNKVFFIQKKKIKKRVFCFHLVYRETDVRQRAQEANDIQERFVCAETEIIDVWDCRLGRHGYSLLVSLQDAHTSIIQLSIIIVSMGKERTREKGGPREMVTVRLNIA